MHNPIGIRAAIDKCVKSNDERTFLFALLDTAEEEGNLASPKMIELLCELADGENGEELN